MSEKPTYTIKELSQPSATVLRNALNQSGWTKTIGEFVVAAELLARVIPEGDALDERPSQLTPNYAEALTSWKKTELEWSKKSVPDFTLSEKQRDSIKSCLKYHIEKSQMPPSKPAFDLMVAFGLNE